MQLFSDKVHQQLFFWSMVLLLVSMPFSTFGMSVAQILLAFNFVSDGRWPQKWELFKSEKVLWLVMSIYLLHVLGLLHTENMAQGIKDLKIKLPLLLLPLYFVMARPLQKGQMKKLSGFFVAAVFTCTLWGSIRYYSLQMHDFRMLSPFISHIRLGLMVCLSIGMIVYYAFLEKSQPLWQKVLALSMIAWLLFYLFIMQSLTSMFVLLAVSLVWLLRWSFRKSSPGRKWILGSLAIALLIAVIAPFWIIFKQFKTPEKPDYKSLEVYTPLGNPYLHDTLDMSQENGHYIYLYVQEEEMAQEWNKRSQIPYDSLNASGYKLKYTLLRFLASKGLRKDAQAVISLTDAEVKAIEDGVANVLYLEWPGIFKRIHQTAWEYFSFTEHDYLADFSFIQRIINWKAALSATIEKPLLGWGTGDVLDAAVSQEIHKKFPRPVNNKLRPHNQFLAFSVAFGIPGLLWILFVLLYAPWRKKVLFHPVFFTFILIALVSFFGEDTLETQAGVTFFAVFYYLFLFDKDTNGSTIYGRNVS